MSHDVTLALKFNLNCVQKFNSSRPLALYQEDADDSIASPTAKDAARQKNGIVQVQELQTWWIEVIGNL